MISGVDLKKILYEDLSLIKKVLESMGCKHIHKSNNRISSTRPDGDNKQAVNIILSETLNAKVYTRNDFEDKYEICDIITLTQYFLDINFNEAINYICNVCNIENSGEYIKREETPSMSFLKRYKRIIKEEFTTEDVILDDKILDLFVNAPCKIFTDDGIDIPTQEFWGVAYDILTNRAVFPIRNYTGGIISFKGRTLEINFKLLGIPKYYVYFEVETSHILFGEFENKDYIKNADYIILVESEKSVMKLWQMGYRNCVAIGRKSISRQQRNKLLSYGKALVIAFDNDVKEKELQIISRMFKGLIPVSYTLDKFNLLNEKDSPCDNGLHIFEQLLETRIEFKE